jgi:putative phage-type endonuclease
MAELERDEWLAKRKEYLTASDVAAVLGVDPRRGPLAVYAAKVGTTEDDFAGDWLDFGRDVEGAIANLYQKRTGRTVKDLGATTLCVHPEIPWLAATLDRVVEHNADELTPLELKSVQMIGVSPRQWEQQPPVHYQVQLLIQCACIGADWGTIAGLFPGYELAHRDLDFDADLFANMVPKLEDFWKCVQDKTPPPIDQLPGTLDVVKRLYADEDGETVDMSCHMELIEQWEAAKLTRNGCEKRVKKLEAQLRSVMGKATFGRLNDGTIMTLKTTHKKGHTVKPTSYRTLRRSKVKGI